MAVVIVTGSAGLVGSETVRHFCARGFDVAGIDNNMRSSFFGNDSSTEWMRLSLQKGNKNYTHHDLDIRDWASIEALFKRYSRDVSLIVHTAAQPSHDWAAKDPMTDFSINASGTLTLLENTRRHCPEAVFIFTSTNKVYGDAPNRLPLVELSTRYEIKEGHKWRDGIDETMSIDFSTHSLFGVSKAAADLLTQEYGRYFGLKTACFRGGCLTGGSHSGTMLHGFLSYIVRCAITGKKYEIYGYKGKQVRDNIHSRDLVEAFSLFYENPRHGEVYNIGGGRHSNLSVLEAIELCREITGRRLDYEYVDKNRTGDHIWWISGVNKFISHYPQWKPLYGSSEIMAEIYETQKAILAGGTTSG